jgi:hypothetical protein
MYRWSACPGSVRVSKGMPNTSSKYAEEGTEAHEYAAAALSTTKLPVMGSVPEDMMEAVNLYAQYVLGLLQAVKPGELHVVDFKYGAGIAVEVTGNPQLRYYGLGTLLTVPVSDTPLLLVEHRFDLSSVYPGCFGTADAVVVGAGRPSKVVLHIVQPRCNHPDGPVRREELPALDMLDFRADLISFAQATEAPDAPLSAGDHCRFCPGAAVCPELQAQANQAATIQFSAPSFNTGGIKPYDPEALRKALDSREVIKAWLKALDEFAYAEAEAGRTPPGYKLVAKRAVRKWKSEGDVLETLQDLGIKPEVLFAPRELKSPAQLETVVDKKVLAPFIVAESSGHTLAPESDKRPAIKPSAADDFSPALPSN